MQQEVEETQVDEEPLATQNLHTSAVHAPVPSTDPSSTGPSENPSANHSSSAVQASPALSGQPEHKCSSGLHSSDRLRCHGPSNVCASESDPFGAGSTADGGSGG